MQINTTKGEMDEALLEKREGREEKLDPDGSVHDFTVWIEYWLDGELVHRSAHCTLLKWPEGMELVGAKLFPGIGPVIEGVKGESILAKIG